MKKVKSILLLVILLAPVLTMAQVELVSFIKQHALTSADNGLINGLVLNLDADYKAPNAGLTKTWPDLSGNNNSANMVNNPAYFAKSPAYFAFSGSNNANLNFVWPNNFTCIFWVYPVGAPGGKFSRLLSTNADNFEIAINNDNKISYYTKNVGWQQKKATLCSNKWSQLVFVKVAGSLKIYLNGKNVHTAPFSLNAGDSIVLGQRHYATEGASFWLNKVLIYNVGLSENDIATDFNVQKSSFGL